MISLFEVSKRFWSKTVTEHEKWHPPEGFFLQAADKIASGLKSASKDYKTAMSRLNFYINRAGKNLADIDKSRLENAKTKLAKLFGETLG